MHRRILTLIVFVVGMTGCSRSAPPMSTPAPDPAAGPAASGPAASGPAASGPAAPTGGADVEFRGAYSRGFEASWFAPCDAPRDDALWWVTLSEGARFQRDSLLRTLTAPATGALAVRWRGTISARMPAGQMGRGTRYLLVTEVLEVAPLPVTGACGPGGRTT